MEIAAGGKFKFVSYPGLEFIAKLAHAGKIKEVMAIGMRRGDDARDSLRDRGFRHRHGFFDRLRAIIEARQNVTMQINHSD